MTYRDRFEQCPRCSIDLTDARSARGCTSCKGLWIEEAIVNEMVLAMLPPQPLSRLQLAVLGRGDPPAPCPSCKQVMDATEIHGVALDRCAKHGVWFDAGELELALRRVADPDRVPPLAKEFVVQPAPATRSQPAAGTGVVLTMVVSTPGQPVREMRFDGPVIKIGKVATAHVRLDDPAVSRMHAVIDVDAPDAIAVIDLGSSHGTVVNGQRINKARLRSGDVITVGATTIAVEIT